MKKIYLITGANGFLGNNIVRQLEEKDDVEIRALIIPGDKVHSLEGLKVKLYSGDVTNRDTMKEFFTVDPEDQVIVIHCAAIVYIKNKYSPLVTKVNVEGTKNIVAEVEKINARMVYVCSVHAMPELPKGTVMKEISDFDPEKVIGQYAKTKATAAAYVLNEVKQHNLNACIVQPSGIIGPNDYGNSHLTQLVEQVSKNKLPACVDGGYDFADVRDVARGIILASEKGKAGECYLLSNRYYSTKELVDLISEASHAKKVKTVFPLGFINFVAPMCEAYYNMRKETPLFTKYSLYTLNTNSNFSNEKAKKELGYTTRDMSETIKDTYTWLKQQGRI